MMRPDRVDLDKASKLKLTSARQRSAKLRPGKSAKILVVPPNIQIVGWINVRGLM